MNGFSQTDIFTMALGLTEPWRVTKVEMIPSEKNPDRMEVHITVDYQEGSKFPCPECGESCPIYDSKQKVWRHLNFFQYRCYIHSMRKLVVHFSDMGSEISYRHDERASVPVRISSL